MATNGGATTESSKAKEAIVYALCKRYSIESHTSSEGILGNDIKTLVSNIAKLSADGTLKNEEEVMKWVAFADNFLADVGARAEALKGLNDELLLKSVLIGGGLNSSEADIVVYAVLHPFVNDLSSMERQKYPNVLRWVDYIQNKEEFSNAIQKIQLEKIELDFPEYIFKDVGKVASDTNPKKGAQNIKTTDKPEAVSDSKKSDKPEAVSDSKKSDKPEANSKSKKSETEKKLPKDAKAADEKKASSDTSTSKDSETSVSLLNIKVGLIVKAWKHPSADSLLVEEIDVGEGSVRQVVSGLAKYCTPEELTNRRVVLITNVKPGKLRDVTSAGLVLCASSKDQTAVEPLLAPKDAKIGERISISGHDDKPEDVLNPKKKQLDKITPYLSTDDKGIATFKGIPFMTSAGPCTSSITNGSVK